MLYLDYGGALNVFDNGHFVSPQLHNYDQCIAKNEEALRIDPHFAGSYGNMANAWKVLLSAFDCSCFSICCPLQVVSLLLIFSAAGERQC